MDKSERYLKDIASTLKDIKRELQKMNRSDVLITDEYLQKAIEHTQQDDVNKKIINNLRRD